MEVIRFELKLIPVLTVIVIDVIIINELVEYYLQLICDYQKQTIFLY